MNSTNCICIHTMCDMQNFRSHTAVCDAELTAEQCTIRVKRENERKVSTFGIYLH